MKNKDKIVGSIVLLGIIAIFLVFGYVNTRPQNIYKDDLEKIFVESDMDDKKIFIVKRTTQLILKITIK